MTIKLPERGQNPQGTPQIQAQGVAAPAGNPGQIGALGQSLGKLGQVAAAAAGMMEAEHTAAETKQAYTALADFTMETTEGEGGYLRMVGQDAVGANRAKTLEAIEQRAQVLEQGLHSDNARQMFRDNANRYLIGAKRRIYDHEAKERRAWNVGQSDAMRIQSSREAIESFVRGEGDPAIAIGAKMAADRQDPDGAAIDPNAVPFEESAGQVKNLWRMHLRTAIEQAEERSNLLGESAAVRAERVLETTTAIYGGIVERLVDEGRTDEAADFLEKAPAGRIDPRTRAKLGKSVRVARRADNAFIRSNAFLDAFLQERGTAEAEADDGAAQPPTAEPLDVTEGGFGGGGFVTGGGFGDDAAPLDPAALLRDTARSWSAEQQQQTDPGFPVEPGRRPPPGMIRAASEEFRRQFEAGEIDAQTRDMMMSRVREQQNIMAQEWAGHTETALLEAEQYLEQNGGSVDDPVFPQSLRQDLADRGVLDKVRTIEGRLQDRGTDASVYGDLLRQFDAGALAGKTNTWLFNRYYHHLSLSDWRQAQSLLASANPSIKPPPEDDFFPLQDQILEQAFEGGIVTGRSSTTGRPIPDGDDEAKLYSEFRAELQKRANGARAAKGRDLSMEEKVALAQSLAFEKAYVPDDEFFSVIDPEVHLWQQGLTENQRKNAYIDLDDGVFSDTEQKLAKIPQGGLWDIMDGHRLNLLPPSSRGVVQQRIRDIRSQGGYEDESVRAQIESIWQQLGIEDRVPTPSERARAWARMEQTVGSRWYRWSEK